MGAEVVVIEGAGAGDAGTVASLVLVVVVGSLQPNQPGVLHVELEVLDVLVVDVVVVVVVSSRQPHHPGVWQVVVRVLVEVKELDFDVVVSDPLLSKYFQLKQSIPFESCTHSGTVSSFSRTSSMTTCIRWFPMPTRQPKSLTVSYSQIWPA